MEVTMTSKKRVRDRDYQIAVILSESDRHKLDSLVRGRNAKPAVIPEFRWTMTGVIRDLIRTAKK